MNYIISNWCLVIPLIAVWLVLTNACYQCNLKEKCKYYKIEKELSSSFSYFPTSIYCSVCLSFLSSPTLPHWDLASETKLTMSNIAFICTYRGLQEHLKLLLALISVIGLAPNVQLRQVETKVLMFDSSPYHNDGYHWSYESKNHPLLTGQPATAHRII